MRARVFCLLTAALLAVLSACTPPAPVEPPVSSPPPPPVTSAPVPAQTPGPDEGPGAYLERFFDDTGRSEFWATFDPGSGPCILYADREVLLSRLRDLMDGAAWERAEASQEVPWDENPPGRIFSLRLVNPASYDCLNLQWPDPCLRFAPANAGTTALWRCTGDYENFYTAFTDLWHEVDAQGAAERLTAFLFSSGDTVLLQAEGARYTLEDRSRVEALLEQMNWSPGEPREDPQGGMTLCSMEETPYGSVTLYPDGPEVRYYLDEYNQFWYRAQGDESLYDLLLEEAAPARVW